MRWEDERYVRWYTRNVPEWSVLDWRSRGLFGLILREVDRAGILPLGKLGLKAIAVQVRAPWLEIEPFVAEILADGMAVYLEEHECLLLPNFVSAQEAIANDKARQRAARERARDALRAQSLGLPAPSRRVTYGVTVKSLDVASTSRDVTERHADSRAGHSEPNRTEPSRAEPTPNGAPPPGTSDAQDKLVRTALRSAAATSTAEADQIRERILSHREFADLDAQRIAEHAVGFMQTGGFKLDWVLTSIDVCAARVGGDDNARSRQALLVGFLRKANLHKPEATSKPAIAVAQSAEIAPDRAEQLRKAQAEKRAKAEAARLHNESLQANGGKH